MTGRQIIDRARDYVEAGTRWRHCGRSIVTGVDCSGLLLCTLNDLGAGIPIEGKLKKYTRGDEYKFMIEEMRKRCDEIFSRKMGKAERSLPKFKVPLQDGDIMVFRFTKMDNHCGFYTKDNTMIHAYDGANINKVVEHPIDESWWIRLSNVFRYEGVKP